MSEKNNTPSTISQPGSRLKKNVDIADNPFSARSKDLGSSSINNPINSGNYGQPSQNRGNPYMQGMPEGRETPNTRERLRMAANNLLMK